MKKILFKTIILIFAILPVLANAQDDSLANRNKPHLAPKINLKDRFYFGGNFELFFGTTNFINLSPIVGYKITEDLSAGAGIIYQYSSGRDQSGKFTTAAYGARIFGRYNIIENLYAYTEYEVLTLQLGSYSPSADRINITSVLAGGGYRQSIGGKVYLNILVLWNLTPSIYSAYMNPTFPGGNPIIRSGITFGM